MLGPPGGGRLRRPLVAGLLLLVLGLQLAVFAHFWPIWTNELISRSDWQRRMWFDSWV
jgi:dolichyl-phosphate-mannose--protein O-mannosyl transferase